MKKFKYIIVLFVMGLISFSCTDLDEEIFSEITTDNYYQNSNNIYAALVNNYAKAFSTGWSDARYFLQEVTADHNSLAFGVYLRLVIRDGPLTQTVLYLQET